ncbi:hypothetical protein [Paracoccus ravus]|uniref:hypothetical protein n=1 Tax=Paracoccus ravus TaxID=2447760 RepID=UPI001AD98908|nr:hypothetical protein [Paracoccus ravus]
MKKFAISAVAVAALLVAMPVAAGEWKPERPVEFVVASGAGGGTDNFARTIQAILTKADSMGRPMVVLNKGAGSGAEAFLYAKQNAGDPHKVPLSGMIMEPEIDRFCVAGRRSRECRPSPQENDKSGRETRSRGYIR